MFNKESFSTILDEINKTYNSMTEFGNMVSFDRSYISKYINKRLDNPPTPKILEEIANASHGLTTYEDLMIVCGYLGNLSTAVYDFCSAKDKRLIDKSISYALTNDLSIEDINTNEYINKVLSELDSIEISKAVEQIKLGIDSGRTNAIKAPHSAVVFVYGTIPAGIPMECIEDIIDTEEIPADMLKGGKQYFGLKIKGDSMEPDYLDGDVIILQKVNDCESGEDAVVMVNGNKGTFKRVRKSEQGITLQPLNPIFEPKSYTNEEIERLPVKIIGVFEELRRKKKKK